MSLSIRLRASTAATSVVFCDQRKIQSVPFECAGEMDPCHVRKYARIQPSDIQNHIAGTLQSLLTRESEFVHLGSRHDGLPAP
jgi:hypothetical protein